MKLYQWLLINIVVVVFLFILSSTIEHELQHTYTKSVVIPTSILLALCVAASLKDQKTIVKILSGLILITIMFFLYWAISYFKFFDILYVDYFVFLILLNVVILYIVSPTETGIGQPAEFKLKNPVTNIVKGRLSSEFQLRIFYEDYYRNITSYNNFLRTILSIGRDELSDENWNKVNSLIEPILLDLEEKEPFSKITGKEKESINNLYNLFLDNYRGKNKEVYLLQLRDLVDSIYERQRLLEDEERKNKQAYNLSLIGLLLTIILSLLSIMISIFNIKIY